MPVLLQVVAPHVEQPRMHWADALVGPLRVEGLVAKVEGPRISVVYDAVGLYSVADALKLLAASIVLTFSLHLAGLLVHQKVLREASRFPRDEPRPRKEFVHLTIWALLLQRRRHQRILAAKEVTK